MAVRTVVPLRPTSTPVIGILWPVSGNDVVDGTLTIPGRRGHIAYLTVLYPFISHTFIHREVAGFRSRGVDVTTFSLNGVDRDTLLTAEERDDFDCTIEIKTQSVRRLATAIGRNALRHPRSVATTLLTAVRGCGLDVRRTMKRFFQVGEALFLYDRCRQLGIRHIHAHFGQAPANVAWFTTRFGNLVDAAGSSQNGEPGPGSAWTFSATIHGPQDCLDEPAQPLQRKVDASTAFVAVSDFTSAQLLRKIDPDLWTKVHVIRCGIDIDSGPDIAISEGTVSEGIPDRSGRTPSILMVARISPEKGHLVALEALAELHTSGIDVRLRLVGPGDFERDIAPRARELGIESIVENVGPLDPHGVGIEMRAATVFALPSFAEGLPVVLMEAMSAGLPAVATGISGIPELVEDGVTGLLVPPARSDLLAAALKSLLTDADLRTDISRNARERVKAMHDGERQIELLDDLFVETGVVAARPRGVDRVVG